MARSFFSWSTWKRAQQICINELFISLPKKTFMESAAAKRPRMSEVKEPTQTSSKTKEVPKCVNSKPTFEYFHNRPDYVDKTMFIKELLSDGHVLITAPSRFGKSLNMSMVRKFIEIKLNSAGFRKELGAYTNGYRHTDIHNNSENLEYFKGTKIFDDYKSMYKYFGKYPTIHVDFSDVKGITFEQILIKLRVAVNAAFLDHDHLRKSTLCNQYGLSKSTFMKYYDTEESKLLTQAEVENGLAFLSRYLQCHHTAQVYVLIDEFDAPINAMVYNNIMKAADKDLTIKCLQSITSNLFNRSSEFLAGSLLNASQQHAGILLENLNVSHYPFMRGHEYCKFYGFLEDEVHELLKRVEKTEQFDLISHYYNGYKTKLKATGRDIVIYSPWAISQYLRHNILDTYLTAGISEKIRRAIGHPQIRSRISQIINKERDEISYVEKLEVEDIEILCQLVCGNTIETKYEDLFIQFLYEQGFFYPISSTATKLQLAIPNQSVFNRINEIVYDIILKNSFNKEYLDLFQDFNNSLDYLGKSCTEKDIWKLATCIENILKVKPPVCELDFQCQLYLPISNRFILVSNERRTFEGEFVKKCDMVFITNSSTGIIIEVKYGSEYPHYQNYHAAYAQIFKKKYDTLLDDARLKELFPSFKGTIEKRIYLGIHTDEDASTISIKYSIDGRKQAYTFRMGSVHT